MISGARRAVSDARAALFGRSASNISVLDKSLAGTLAAIHELFISSATCCPAYGAATA
jgi:dolichol kinase